MPGVEATMGVSSPSVLPRKTAVAFVVLCVAGLALSIELARIHVLVHTDPDYHAACAISEGVDCETVALSPYAVFAGIPVAVWGLLGYFAMAALGTWSLAKRRLHPAWPWGLLLSLATVSVLSSVVLATISAMQIDSLCLLCMGTYLINAGLLATSIVAWKQSRLRVWNLLAADVRSLVARPWILAALVLAGLVALLGLEFHLPRYWKTPGWTDLPQLPEGLDPDGHHFIGAAKPTLTILEFSDYECPYCRKAHKEVRSLVAKYPRQLRLIHRHLPLDQACHPGLRRPLHQRACEFAEAAECAGDQGRFWEMNDALFSTQEKVKARDLNPMDLAIRIGLNRPRFKQCMEKHATASRIANDVREGMARNLSATPSFIIGNEVFRGRIPEADLVRWLKGSPHEP